MERISSPLTLFLKFGFPTMWCGFLSLFAIAWATSRGAVGASFWLPGIVFAAATAVILWWLVPLKNVRLDGDTLVVSNYLRSTRIPVREISRVRQHWDSGRTITLSFANDTQFGKSIRFVPDTFCLWGESPVVLRLRDMAGISR